MNIPAEFYNKIDNNDWKWFLQKDNVRSETLIVTETKVLVDGGNKQVYLVGVKTDKYTVVYLPIINIEYMEERAGSEYFNISLQGTGEVLNYQLLAINGIEHNLSNEVITNKMDKMVHLFAGQDGKEGKPGKQGLSSYDMWSRKYPGVSEDTFIANIDAAYRSGARITQLNRQLEEQNNQIQLLMNEMVALRKAAGDGLPISTIIFSHIAPSSGVWLPFGKRDLVYWDRDYPELAKIVKSWGGDFIVDEDRFRLGDASDKNRYIFCAGGDRPAGFVMSSQLPNLRGWFLVSPDAQRDTSCSTQGLDGVFVRTGGCTNFIHYIGNRFTSGCNGVGDERKGVAFNAGNYNSIYKDGEGLTPFGESLSMNAWIKAKQV